MVSRSILLILCVPYGYIYITRRTTNSTAQMPRQQNHDRMKLSFIIAGVQKAGTTALYHYLRQHPHLSLPARKESHFFDNEKIDWTTPNYTAYESALHFRNRSAIAGEATHIYIYWPNSLARIKRYNPDIKLILLFRQPVQRAWSHWTMEYAHRHETKPFSWSIREGRNRLSNGSNTSDDHRTFSYVERGFYGAQLRRVLQLFPHKQLLMILSEDLQANPTRVIQRVSRFLGVPQPPGKVEQRKSHVSRKPRNKAVLERADLRYLQNLYHNDLKLFGKLSGLNITAWFL